MSILSMTGFARVTGQMDGLSWVWEVKSVNGKGMDVRARLPQGLEYLEAQIRDAAQRHVRRGNLQLTLQLDRSATAAVSINEAALAALITRAEALRAQLDAPPVRVEGLLAIRGIVEPVEVVTDEAARAARDRAMLASLDEALQALSGARRAEGEKIAVVLEGQIARIATLTEAARSCPARSPEAVRARLAELVARLMDGSGAVLDPDRLHQEAVLVAARADIEEELDRLSAHVAAARALLAESGPVGRKLDFLAQEFNREANTLCSKANDLSLTSIGLDLKTVIDQLREQVQNIE